MKMRTIKNPPFTFFHDDLYYEALARYYKKKRERKNKYRMKLNFEKATTIRIRYQNYNWSISRLSKKYGVSRRQIGRILNFKCWLP